MRRADWRARHTHQCSKILREGTGWTTAEIDEVVGAHPRWSPDSRTLAYLSSSPSGKTELCLLTDKHARVLCSLPTGSHGLQWSPSGDVLSFIAPVSASPGGKSVPLRIEGERPEPLELWLVDAATGNFRCWSQLAGAVSEVAWHPRGESVACCVLSTARPEDWDTGSLVLLSMDRQQAAPMLIEHCQRAVWSPSGDELAVLRLQDPTFIAAPAIEIIDNNGQTKHRYVMEDDSQIVSWTARGILILQAKGPCSLPFWMDPENGNMKPALAETPEGFTIIEGWFGEGCAMTSDGRTLSATAFDVDHPGEAALLDLYSGSVTVITQALESFHRWDLPTPECIQWKAEDGTEIEGILIPPRQIKRGKRHPLVVVLHGGPTAMSSQAPLADNDWIWGPIPQLVARGAFVLLPNYRGSVGYGPAFKAANVGSLGQSNAMDIVSGIESLIERGLVDHERVGAVGASHGGYLAAFLAAYTNVLSAAVMRSGISDWVLNADLNLNPDWENQYFGGSSTQQPAAYKAASTLPYIDRATAPTLILHGDQDRQAPVANARVLYRRLQEHSVPSKLIVYRGMGHGGASLEQNEHSLQETLAWFEQWLGLDSFDGK